MASLASANSAWDWPGGSASSTTITSDGLNRNAAAGYDGNGNLTYDGTRTFTYDPENRLLTESGPVSMALSYDPMGRLQQSVIGGATTQFLYDGDALVAEYSGGAVTERYVHGPAADNPVIAFAGPTATTSTASYVLADRQGSIVATANSAGTLTANQTYDAYGVPNAWTGTRFRYTGQIVIPQAQLYYYKARVYDPVAGRFLQTDPVGYGPDVNWYAYVGDDPVNREDPTGEVDSPPLPQANTCSRVGDTSCSGTYSVSVSSGTKQVAKYKPPSASSNANVVPPSHKNNSVSQNLGNADTATSVVAAGMGQKGLPGLSQTAAVAGAVADASAGTPIDVAIARAGAKFLLSDIGTVAGAGLAGAAGLEGGPLAIPAAIGGAYVGNQIGDRTGDVVGDNVAAVHSAFVNEAKNLKVYFDQFIQAKQRDPMAWIRAWGQK